MNLRRLLSGCVGANLAGRSRGARSRTWRGMEVLESRVMLTTVSIVVTDQLAAEHPGGGDTAAVTITRDNTVGDLLVNYFVFGLTAGAEDGVDWETLANLGGFGGNVVIPNGSASVTLTIVPIDDDIKENQNNQEHFPFEGVEVRLADGNGYERGEKFSATVFILDDDQDEQHVGIHASDPNADLETSDTGKFTVVRAGDISGPLDVLVSFSSNEGAVQNVDYTLSPGGGIVTIPAGQHTADILLTPLQGGSILFDYNVRAEIQESNDYDAVFNIAVNTVVAVNVTDLPTVQFALSDTTAIEPSDPGEFIISRSDVGDTDLVVPFTISGSATNGVDYQLIASPAVIPAGSTSVTIPIHPIDDLLDEDYSEQVTLTLLPSAAYNIGPTNTNTTHIVDNDSDQGPLISLSLTTDVEATEDGAVARFLLSRSEDLNGEVEVHYVISGTATNGEDYQPIANSIVFTDLLPFTTIIVTPIDDANPEPLESVTITLVENAAYRLGSSVQQSVTLADNDGGLAEVQVFAEELATEGGSQGRFRFTRAGSTAQTLTVHYAASGEAVNGTDYNTLSGQITFPIGASEFNLNINPIDDDLVEGGQDGIESVIITLTPNANYQIGPSGVAQGGIIDNDVAGPPTVSISSLDPTASEALLDPATFTLTRTGDTTASLTVQLQVGGTASPEDYDNIPISLTFQPGQSVAQRTVTPFDDLLIEDDLETIVITIVPSGSYEIGGNGSVTLTIADDDEEVALPVVNITATDAQASESGDTGQFTLTRNGNINNALVVSVAIGGSATNGTDYATLAGPFTIPAGQTSAVITVTPIDDDQSEATETVTLTLAAADTYDIGVNNSAIVSILDNDGANLAVQIDASVQLPSPAIPGDVLNLTGTATNTGGGAVGGNVVIGIYLLPANQSAPGVNDTPLATATIKASALKTGGTPAKWKAKATIPGNLIEGSYHLVAVVDPQNTIPESNESDNAAATASTQLALLFGEVPGRAKAVKKTTINGVTYSISGPGVAQVLRGQGNQPDSLSITNATSATSVTGKAATGTQGQINDITIQGSAKAVNLKGFRLVGDVNVSGLLNTLSIGDTATQQSLVIAGADPTGKATFSLTAQAVQELAITSSIPIKSITATAWTDPDLVRATITAPSIRKIAIAGDFEADITVTDASLADALKSLAVSGVLDSTIRSAGGIGAVSAGRIVNSRIFAGIHAGVTSLPASAADFINQNAAIKSLTVKGIKNDPAAGFVNSLIAAATVGTVSLKTVQTDNSQTPFGVATDTLIKSFTFDGGPSLKNVTTVGDTTLEDDFILRVV